MLLPWRLTGVGSEAGGNVPSSDCEKAPAGSARPSPLIGRTRTARPVDGQLMTVDDESFRNELWQLQRATLDVNWV